MNSSTISAVMSDFAKRRGPAQHKAAIVSAVMSDLANRRTPDQCKGGRPRKVERCRCGLMTKARAEARRHKC
jgi:hypothetical protein